MPALPPPSIIPHPSYTTRPVALSSLIKSPNYRALTMCSSGGSGSYLFCGFRTTRNISWECGSYPCIGEGIIPSGRRNLGNLAPAAAPYNNQLATFFLLLPSSVSGSVQNAPRSVQSMITTFTSHQRVTRVIVNSMKISWIHDGSWAHCG